MLDQIHTRIRQRLPDRARLAEAADGHLDIIVRESKTQRFDDAFCAANHEAIDQELDLQGVCPPDGAFSDCEDR